MSSVAGRSSQEGANWGTRALGRRACSFDSCLEESFALGYCLRHYQQHKTGAELTRLKPLFDRDCSFDGCPGTVDSRGLCAGHRKQQREGKELRPLRHYSSPVGSMCAFEGCLRKRERKAWCGAHYGQWKKGRPLKPLRETRGPCQFEGCGRPQYSDRGWCSAHDKQWRKSGNVQPIGHRRGQPRLLRSGYVQITDWEHPNANSAGRVLEHVMVVTEMLGRPLTLGENVHHKNGVKHDNRPENLELWTTHQPSGQRVEDLVEWAHEILRRYGGGRREE